MKKWMVYYISEGVREGNEYIWANTREEALEEYKRYFNISKNEDCKAIPVIDGNMNGHR